MNKKTSVDLFGSLALISFSLLLGINHVVIKVVNEGLHPIFFAGLRSILAFIFLLLIMKVLNKQIIFKTKHIGLCILAGLVFALEFLFLFLALDYTTVSKNSVIYYSMPVWLIILGHFLLPNEKLNSIKVIGLLLAFCGVVLSVIGDPRNFEVNTAEFFGDFFAILAALTWAILILLAKGTKFNKISPEMQLVWMVMVSGPLLLIFSVFFSEPVRNFSNIHLLGLLFQSVVVVACGFLFWLWLLSIYPASGVASFSFLTPVFTIFFGWLLLDEILTSSFIFSASLVVIGLILINKPTRGSNKSQ